VAHSDAPAHALLPAPPPRLAEGTIEAQLESIGQLDFEVKLDVKEPSRSGW
jgi:hypothetical protein